MKRIAILFLVLLALLLFSETELRNLYEPPGSHSPSSVQARQIRGIFLSSGEETDFPSQPDLHADQMTQEARSIVAAAKESGMNSLFYEAQFQGNALYTSNYFEKSPLWYRGGGYSYGDPLKILCEEGAKEGISVFAVIDLFTSNSEAMEKWPQRDYIQRNGDVYLDPFSENTTALLSASMDELTKKYDLAGILITDSSKGLETQPDYYAQREVIVQECHQAVKLLDKNRILGFACDVSLEEDGSQKALEALASKGVVDFVCPVMDSSKGTLDGSYQAGLSSFIDITESVEVPVVPINLIKEEMKQSHELSYRLFINHQMKLEGGIVGGYAALLENSSYLLKEAQFMFEEIFQQDLDGLNIRLSRNLSVTYPEDGAVLAGSWCFVTGLSNPKESLTVNGQPVENRGENGSFGVLLPLQLGDNVLEFEQPSRFASITVKSIQREAETGILPTDKISPGSAFPHEDTAIRNDSSIRLSCVAPSGGEVTARLGENTYVLQPQNTYAQDGVPVTYSTDMILRSSNLKQTETVNAGIVTYSLTYDGLVTNQKSLGTLYLMGSRAELAVEVDKYSADVLEMPQEGAKFLTSFRSGVRDFVSGSYGNYYQLESGGYIAKEDVSILTGNADVEQPIENVILQSNENEERLVFIGGQSLPCHFSYDSYHRELSLKVFHGQGIPDILAHLKSDMFNQISIEKETDTNNAVITMKLKEGAVLWGYNAFQENGNLVVQLKKAPPPSDDPSLPLKGMKILLDPGHGGADAGYFGVAGQAGPSEKELTLLTAKLLKSRLERYGAEVYLTRSDDTALVQDKRLQMVFSFNGDMLLSLHYNGVSYEEDGNRTYGIEGHYSNGFSQELAGALTKNLAEDMGRINRGTGHFYSSRIMETNLSPAVELELGYLTNPQEYEKSCNAFEMYQAVCSIADTIVDYMENLPANRQIKNNSGLP